MSVICKVMFTSRWSRNRSKCPPFVTQVSLDEILSNALTLSPVMEGFSDTTTDDEHGSFSRNGNYYDGDISIDK